MRKFFSIFVFFLFLNLVSSKIYFEENFDDEKWEEKWIRSSRKDVNGKPYGNFNWTAGRWFYDENDKGIRTMDDQSYYAISTKFPRFSNRNKTLVVQFSVKFESKADLGDTPHCASAFIKLFPSSHNPKFMDENSRYLMKFGPDTCSSAHRIESTIFYRGKNWPFNRRLDYDRGVYIYMPFPFLPDDPHTHLYTFVFYPNNTFEKRVDGRVIVEESGHMEQCWQTHPLREVKVDPNEERPEDWDEREFIIDPSETKPADWDQPMLIPDPHASRPEDWNENSDGEWEHPLMENPNYKGEWFPTKLIPNPNYKGKFEEKMMKNPNYFPDSEMYLVKDIGAIGIEGWQQQAGTIFDNILITDDLQLALSRGLPIQQKSHQTESKFFIQFCENQRLQRVAEIERIAKEKKRIKKLMQEHQKHRKEEL